MTPFARSMRLADLLAGFADPGAAADTVVHGLETDSRLVRTGYAFVALQGQHQHGITFAPAALAHGAAFILAEAPDEAAPAPALATPLPPHVPVIWIAGLRDKLGAIAARFFDDPSTRLRVIGVTGTNGKTSVVQLLAQALSATGRRVATIGTLGAGMHGAIEPGEFTTPEPIAVQSSLARFREAGADDVAMEVSSHGLDQGRVNAVAFALAVFTNLSRDHLDYHGTMEAYGAAKQRLFTAPGLGAAVINVDDAFGRQLVQRVPPDVDVLCYGIDAPEAPVRAAAIVTDADGIAFDLVTPWGGARVATPLLGYFNVYNLLAVAASLGQLGVPFVDLCAALRELTPVAGRMTRLGGGAALPLVVIDYSHTPDALQQALTSLRAHCAGTLVCVFGCGGERDTGKRPQMGAIAESLADRIIITDDNPRGEDGDLIVAQIVAGLTRPQDASIQRNRATAIAQAIDQAGSGDVVLIAGKGHEPYQEIGGVKHDFDDRVIAHALLETRSC